MTPRSAGATKRPAGAKGARSRGSSTGPEVELDESKFSSLTADMCLPHFISRASPTVASMATADGQVADAVAGFFVNKTEAAPSVILRSHFTTPPSPNDVAVHSQADDQFHNLRTELAALRAALANRDAELERLLAADEQARESAAREVEDSLRIAEQAWKADEAVRFAAAEAQWREQSAEVLAEARARIDAARNEGAEEVHRLRVESNALRSTIAEQETKLSKAASDAEQAREIWQRESQAELLKAEEKWKAGEAERLAAAESLWGEQSADAVTETAQTEAWRNQAESDLNRLREELTAARAALLDRDGSLAKIALNAEQARESWQQENQAALAKAKQTWKAEEAARFSAAEARWREQSTRAVAEARIAPEGARIQAEDELRRVREDCT